MSKIVEIIQGDSLQMRVSVGELANSPIIDEIVFCSKRLGIYKVATWNDTLKSYFFALSPEETAQMQPCRADYSLTVRFMDGNVKTPCLKGEIFVREKVNNCGQH